MGRDRRQRLERAGGPRSRRRNRSAGAESAGRAAAALRRWSRCRARLRRDLGLHSAHMKIGVVGLGYVGLPLAVAFCEAGHDVAGADTDTRVGEAVAGGGSHIEDVPDESLAAIGSSLHVSTRYADLAKVEAIIVAVP